MLDSTGDWAGVSLMVEKFKKIGRIFYQKKNSNYDYCLFLERSPNPGGTKKLTFGGKVKISNFCPTEYFLLSHPDLDSSREIMHTTPFSYEFRTKIRRFKV